jgi:hypothetical protein
MQRSAWSLPTSTLPPEIVQAAGWLRAHGFADPRGCEYRIVHVELGRFADGPPRPRTTRGWVFRVPGKAGDFAVCWDGMVHSCTVLPGKPDLRADVEAAAARLRNGSRAGPGAGNAGGPAPNDGSVDEDLTPPAIKVCLLLMLGEEPLARQLFDSRPPVDGAKRYNGAFNFKDPVTGIVVDWAWGVYMRAVSAHEQGDVWAALYAARLLEANGKALQDEIGNGAAAPNVVGRFGFLESGRLLLADEERRAKEGAPPDAVNADPASFPSTRARVQALIRQLDQIAVRQMSVPGYPHPAYSPEVRALVAIGDEALDPLIATMESDERLTRSVAFGGMMTGSRYIVPVAEAAWDAICEILNGISVGASWGSDRHKLAEAVRDYRNRYRGVPDTERWYRVLCDDSATPEAWVRAAYDIIEPAGQGVTGGMSVPQKLPSDRSSPMRGESLRSKRNPSVGELMAKRVGDIGRQAGSARANGQPVVSYRAWVHANQLVLMLARWDAKAALPLLKDRFRATALSLKDTSDGSQTIDMSRLAVARREAGDSDALFDYVTWISSRSELETPPPFLKEQLEPLMVDRIDKRSAALIDRLFTHEPSALNPFLRPARFGLYERVRLLGGEMMAMPAVRKQILKRLSDREAVGTALARGGNTGLTSVELKLEGGTTSVGERTEEPVASAEAVPIRMCDLYAWAVLIGRESPRFELFWPQDRRDAAIAQCADFVRKYRHPAAAR